MQRVWNVPQSLQLQHSLLLLPKSTIKHWTSIQKARETERCREADLGKRHLGTAAGQGSRNSEHNTSIRIQRPPAIRKTFSHAATHQHPCFGRCNLPNTAVRLLSFQVLVNHSSDFLFSSSHVANHTVPTPLSSWCTELLPHFSYQCSTDVITTIHTNISFWIIAEFILIFCTASIGLQE